MFREIVCADLLRSIWSGGTRFVIILKTKKTENKSTIVQMGDE